MRTKTRLIQIGNAQGVRIPKKLLQQAGINGSVEMEVRGDELIIRSPAAKPANPRAGWDEAFKRWIAKNGPIPELTEEERAFIEFPNEFDEKEWTW